MSDLREAFLKAKEEEKEKERDRQLERLRLVPERKPGCAMCTPSVCICAQPYDCGTGV